MDSTIIVALIAAAATVFVAVFGSIATAKLRREEGRRQAESVEAERKAAEIEAHADRERELRDAVIKHWQDFARELQQDNERLRAALVRREET